MPIIQATAKVISGITYERIVSLEATLFKERAKRLFVKSLINDYNEIKKFLPEKATKILDIGCGLAGIDLFLFRHYKNDPKTRLYLLDKNEVDENVYYGFQKYGSFYNSLIQSENFLTENGISKSQIFLKEVVNNKLPQEKFNLIISLISWGYHYPVETYLEEVYQKMTPQGILILDIRKGTRGEEKIKRKFKNSKIISETTKGLRLQAIKL